MTDQIIVTVTFDQILEDLNKNVFQTGEFPALTTEETNVLKAAFTNLSGPKKDRGQANPFTPYAALENSALGQKFALDQRAFQIIRRVHPDKAKFGESWLRYGIEVDTIDGQETIRPFWRKSMYEFNDKKVDPNIDLPESAAHLNGLNKLGTRVIALLGGARININQGMLLIEYVQQLIDNLSHIAVMTGGYRGEEGNSYGITRAGFDVPRSRSLQTMVVMCEAGLGHAHQTANSRSIYGKHWGDDTPGLAAISDVGIFFRNVPPKKNFGAWTEVEIANFLHLGKGIAILDPTLSVDDFPDGIAQEIFFEKPVKVFRDPVQLAAHINELLPTSEAIKSRPSFHPDKEQYANAVYNRRIEGDLLIEDWLAVRLNYQKGGEAREIDDQMKARWVRNDRSPFLQHAIFQFSNQPEAMEEGRDLILSGYWKDIMLLQMLGKLKSDDTNDNLIAGYAQYRKQMEDAFQQPGDKPMDAKARWFDRGKIGEVWFLYRAEHFTGFLSWVKTIELTDYDKKLMAI